ALTVVAGEQRAEIAAGQVAGALEARPAARLGAVVDGLDGAARFSEPPELTVRRRNPLDMNRRARRRDVVEILRQQRHVERVHARINEALPEDAHRPLPRTVMG